MLDINIVGYFSISYHAKVQNFIGYLFHYHFIFLAGFWDMYDPEWYSFWFCEYKYNNVNTVSFVTLNRVNGFLQRMDLACKYAFGKMLVIGSNPPFKTKELWLFHGQEIPQFVIDECHDREFYEWTKVDISDEVQKEHVNQMIEDANHLKGRLFWMEVLQVKRKKEKNLILFYEMSYINSTLSIYFLFYELSPSIN